MHYTDLKLQKCSLFSGYASVFNIKDKHNDIILPGSFKKSLVNHHCYFKLLLEHDVNNAIGEVRAEEDKRGLYVRGKIFINLQKPKEIDSHSSMKYMSIGYQVIKHYKRDNIRYVQEILLHEVSLVSRPANASAKIYNVRQHNHELKIVAQD